MPSFLVKTAVKTADKPDKGYGPMQEIALVLQEYGQAEEIAASWYTKHDTALPEAGSRLEGELEPSQYGMKFKKAKGAGGGGRGRSPEENRRIVRQHSQHMAIRWVEFKQLRGELPSELTTPEGFRQLVDWFHKDAMEGGR